MAEEKKFQYTSQALPDDAVVFAKVITGKSATQVSIEIDDGFDSYITNATVDSPSHEDCLKKVPLLKKGWEKGKLCRYDVPANGKKGLRDAAIYFLGKREDSQPSLPASDTTPSSSGDKGTVGGEQGDKKTRKGA